MVPLCWLLVYGLNEAQRDSQMEGVSAGSQAAWSYHNAREREVSVISQREGLSWAEALCASAPAHMFCHCGTQCGLHISVYIYLYIYLHMFSHFSQATVSMTDYKQDTPSWPLLLNPAASTAFCAA